MGKVRSGLTFLALVGLCGVCLAAAVPMIARGWPNPSAVPRDELQHWLRTEDVQAAPDAMQRKLMWRLEQGLSEGDDTLLQSDALGADGQRFRSNVGLLSRRWIREKLRDFLAVPARW